MLGTLNAGEEAQLIQTIEMFEVITQSQPLDYQSLEILKEAYFKLNRHEDVVRTAKRTAQAYVQLGQLSSAILEYETILQQFPADPDALAAIAQIESTANNLTVLPAASPTQKAEAPSVEAQNRGAAPKESAGGRPTVCDDGRDTMKKLFLESKLLGQSDFDAHWPTPDLLSAPSVVIEPFILKLANRGLTPVESSLRLLSDKARLGYIPLEKYDLDVEFARSFPRDTCRRWCVLPFDRMSKSVFVATTNPFNNQAAMDLRQACDLRVLWYLTPPQDLVKAINKVFR